MSRQIAFSVSAGAYVYQMGIAYYLQSHFDLRDCVFSGASGGAWVSLLLATGKDIRQVLEVMIDIGVKRSIGRVVGLYFTYDRAVRECVEVVFKDVHLPAAINGRLSIALSKLNLFGAEIFQGEMVSEWTSNNDVADCLVASALIPYALNGLPFVFYRGMLCLDGGMTNIEGIHENWNCVEHKISTQSVNISNTKSPATSAADVQNTRSWFEWLLGQSETTNPNPSQTSEEVRAADLEEVLSSDASDMDSPPAVATPLPREDSFPAASPPSSFFKFAARAASILSAAVAETVLSPMHGAMDISNRSSKLTLDLIRCMKESMSQLAVTDVCWSLSDLMVSEAHKGLTTMSESDHVLDDGNRVTSSLLAQQLVDAAKRTTELALEPLQTGMRTTRHMTVHVYALTQLLTQQLVGLMFASSRTASNQLTTSNEPDKVMVTPESSEMVMVAASTDYSHPDHDSPLEPSLPIMKCDGHRFDNSAYWRPEQRECIVKRLPSGGCRMEIAPWSWRKHMPQTFHLTACPDANRKLFELGMLDAEVHHWELAEFFLSPMLNASAIGSS